MPINVAHRTLAILLLVNAISYMDRQLVAILIEPMKREFGMTDVAAGLLYGFAFVVLYATLGIPIARLADRSDRSRVILASLVLFSAMTAAFTWASAYWHLVLARIGVGVGEAGTNPASHSIIADLYPVERRGTAMAVFAAGLHVGVLLGFLVGGFAGQVIGWRGTFLLAGAAGLLLAAAAALLLKEPPRTSRTSALPDAEHATLVQAARALWRSPSMRHAFAGGTVTNIGSAALLAWLPAVLIRSHDLSLSTTGALLAFVFGVLGAVGTILGGLLADRLGVRRPAWRLRVVVVALLVATLGWTLALLPGSSFMALLGLALAGSLVGFHIGPTYAIVQTLAPPDARALAASLLILCTSLVGVSVGPLLVGALSDALAARYGEHSLRTALLVVAPVFLWAAAHYEAASRTLAADLAATDRGGSLPHARKPGGERAYF